MEIIKIVGVGLITCFAYIIVKQSKPDLAIWVALSGGVIILLSLVDYLEQIVNSFSNLVNISGVDNNIMKVVLKIIGIGYLCEFASSICEDSGCSSVADKVTLAGKIIIVAISLPLITNIINIIVGLLP